MRQGAAADTTEPVDADFDGHWVSSWGFGWALYKPRAGAAKWAKYGDFRVLAINLAAGGQTD